MAKKVGSAASKPSSKTKIMGALTALAVAAAVAALGFAYMVNQAASDAIGTVTANQRPVVCAVGDIPAGTEITEDMVAVRNVPGAYAVSGASQDVAEVVGKTAVVTVAANSQVSVSELTGGDANSLADRLEPGRVAYAVAVDAESGVAGNIHQGDFVDIITREDPSETVMEHVKVVALDASVKEDGASDYGTVTLEMTPEAAMQLEAQKTQHSLRFVLSSTAQETSGDLAATADVQPR